MKCWKAASGGAHRAPKHWSLKGAFARFHGARHGIAVTNGTAALEVDDGRLGLQPGDEVIVPNFTFVATASAVLFANALPVLVDVRPDTYCLDPELAEAAITPHTKAIIAVHMGGHPADLDELKDIAERHKELRLVEDCAHAHASEWRGQRVGTFGVAGTFSFQSSKLMTAGEGGMIISNDDAFRATEPVPCTIAAVCRENGSTVTSSTDRTTV